MVGNIDLLLLVFYRIEIVCVIYVRYGIFNDL